MYFLGLRPRKYITPSDVQIPYTMTSHGTTITCTYCIQKCEFSIDFVSEQYCKPTHVVDYNFYVVAKFYWPSSLWQLHCLFSPSRTHYIPSSYPLTSLLSLLALLLHNTETTAASNAATPSGHTHTPRTDPTHHRLLARVLHAFNNMCQWVQQTNQGHSHACCVIFIHSTCISLHSYLHLVVFSIVIDRKSAWHLYFTVSVHFGTCL